MHQYFIKTPWLIRKLFSSYLWKVPETDKMVYLTFDDGPHPAITPWVLQQLKQVKAAATFFCIGKNVVQFPEVYQQILAGGHAVGNHTYHHLNGWKTEKNTYLKDVAKASAVIDSHLFRPPYGRISLRQAKSLENVIKKDNVKVVMWDVLSADFDNSIAPETCVHNVLAHVEPGSVVVFHDSVKAFANLKYALPLVLENLFREGYGFKKLA